MTDEKGDKMSRVKFLMKYNSEIKWTHYNFFFQTAQENKTVVMLANVRSG